MLTSKMHQQQQPHPPLSSANVASRYGNELTLPPSKENADDRLPSPVLPHHQSLRANGNPQYLGSPLSPKAENKRLSALNEEVQRDTKRDSQISNASTNASNRGARARKSYIGPWQLGSTLGKGATGRVRKAKHRITGQYAAVKIVSKRTAVEIRSDSVQAMDRLLKKAASKREDNRRQIPFAIQREVVIMKLIEHPNIIRLYDVWENRGELYLVMEYIEGGELFGHIRDNRVLPEIEAIRIFRQIISGLAYCHRFRLCHRDLKPENILLDRQGNVKIADFGMAVMQHEKLTLQTSCGSPHYAAPEIAQGRPYRGDQVDIWSCGVVLYTMLCGRMPFGTQYDLPDLPKILEEVIRADVHFKEEDDISYEAQHLLYQMLQYVPGQRITINDMWGHPLLLKYDSWAQLPENRATWLGGPLDDLAPADCGEQITRPQDVDRDILKSLCTLWHTADEEAILHSLLVAGPTYEKVFYNSLRKFRIEQEENFQGPAIELSASDYHHIPKPLKRSTTRKSLLGAGHSHHDSRFSIVSGGNVRRPSTRSARSGQTPSEHGTEHSYDPFRPSKHKMTNVEADHAKITVFRHSSDASRQTPSTTQNSLQHPAVSRIRQDSKYSISSSPPPLPRDPHAKVRTLRREMVTSNHSRSSVVSSVNSRSSSLAFRKSTSYKRPISFKRHRRMRSASSGTPPARPKGPTPMSLQQRYIHDQQHHSTPNLVSVLAEDSSYAEAADRARSKKEEQHAATAAARRAKRDSVNFKEDAIRFSSELSKYCDEVFGSDLLSSSPPRPGRLSISSNEIGSELGPRRAPVNRTRAGNVSMMSADYLQRPLPPPPMMAQQMQHELATTIERLKRQALNVAPGTLNEVIAQLERLLYAETSAVERRDADRRVISAPEARGPDFLHLSPVREEGEDRKAKSAQQGLRHVSEPVPRPRADSQVLPFGHDNVFGKHTVRLVPESSALLSPLDFGRREKRSFGGGGYPLQEGGGSRDELSTSAYQRTSRPLQPRNDTNLRPPSGMEYRLSHPERVTLGGDEYRSAGFGLSDNYLDTIDESEDKENNDPRASKRSSGESKIKSWFRRSTNARKGLEQGPSPPEKDDWHAHGDAPRVATETYIPVRGLNLQGGPSRGRAEKSAPIEIWSGQQDWTQNGQGSKRSEISSEELPFHEPKKAKSGFLKFFQRGKEPPGMALIDPSETLSIASSSIDYPYNGSSAASSTIRTSRMPWHNLDPYPALYSTTAGPKNWFARFLHVKPASRVLAFNAPRSRTVKEIRVLFKEWRRYGMRDVVCDKAAGRIWARVHADNSLKVKPVEVMVEVFAVVDRARRGGAGPGCGTGLSVARFEQVRGAKSSFERCVNQLSGVMGGKGLLIPDEEKKAKEMAKCLRQWRR